MLQRFVKPGDRVIFGIEPGEEHRAKRIEDIYSPLGVTCIFPMILGDVNKDQCFRDLEEMGLKLPRMYAEGYSHNNCSGGCVRAGKAHWKITLRVRPDVYADRMRMEEDLQQYLGGKPTILKDMSLRELKELVESQPEMDFGEPEEVECVGICNLEN